MSASGPKKYLIGVLVLLVFLAFGVWLLKGRLQQLLQGFQESEDVEEIHVKGNLEVVPLTFLEGDRFSHMIEFPIVSPDGQYITYQKSIDLRTVEVRPGVVQKDYTDDSNWDIYRRRLDGSGELRLTDAPSLEDQAIWSPDGKTIVYRFLNKENFDIWLMNADGKNKRPLIEAPKSDEKTPAYSADGKEVIFFSNRDDNKWSIYSIDLETKKIERLTSGPFKDKHPQFTPDGRKIVFHSNRSKYRIRDAKYSRKTNVFEIFSLDLEQGKFRQLIKARDKRFPDLVRDLRHPFVSPDGRFVVFHANLYALLISENEGNQQEMRDYERVGRDIFIVSIDGEKIVNLTENDDRVFKHPSWSPDGRGLYFVYKKRNKAWNIGYADVSELLDKL